MVMCNKLFICSRCTRIPSTRALLGTQPDSHPVDRPATSHTWHIDGFHFTNLWFRHHAANVRFWWCITMTQPVDSSNVNVYLYRYLISVVCELFNGNKCLPCPTNNHNIILRECSTEYFIGELYLYLWARIIAPSFALPAYHSANLEYIVQSIKADWFVTTIHSNKLCLWLERLDEYVLQPTTHLFLHRLFTGGSTSRLSAIRLYNPLVIHFEEMSCDELCFPFGRFIRRL